MGRRYEVPSSLTIQKALEHAGYQLVRGCGCRGGICGACATVYRFPDSHRLGVGLACQTLVQPNMHLTQIPFFPANRARYDLEQLEPTGATLAEHYPEIFHCVGCNTCTRACPMEIDVMGYINQAMRGDIARAARTSFDCIQCGMCSARCPAQIAHYHVAQLARRLYGKYVAPAAEHLKTRVAAVEGAKFDDALAELTKMDEEALKEIYVAREAEPLDSTGWEPESKANL